MKCNKCKETECKHENLVYCEVCKKIECKDCGKTWGENQTTFVPYYVPQQPIYVPYEPQYPPYEITWGSGTININDCPGYCESKIIN